MSNEPSTSTGRSSDPESTTARPSPLGRVTELLDAAGDQAGYADAVAVGAGLVALVAVALGVALDVLANLPFSTVGVPSPIRSLAALGIPVVLALALVGVALVAGQTTVRIGLLFAGVFGLLVLVSRAAIVPGLVAVTLGGTVVLLGTDGVPGTYRALRRKVVATVMLAGLAVSMGSSVGLLNGSTRSLGGVLVLGGVAATAIRVEDDRLPLVGGALTFLAVVSAITVSPYVAGSVLLVAFAVVGVPYLLAACAVGGATAATIAGLRRGDYQLAVGAPLVLLAGVPATVPRALAVILGATLVLVEVTPHSSGRDTPREEVPA